MQEKILPDFNNWFICAPTKEQAIQDMLTFLTHIIALGLGTYKINSLVPQQAAQFIHVKLDCVTILATLSL